jgi:flagellar hook-length control protein FliK
MAVTTKATANLRGARGATTEGKADGSFGDMLNQAGRTEGFEPSPIETHTANESASVIATEGNADIAGDPETTNFLATQQGNLQMPLLPDFGVPEENAAMRVNETAALSEFSSATSPVTENRTTAKMMPMTVVNFSPSNNAQAALQSVMPIPTEVAEKNQRMMDMLSGTLLPRTEATEQAPVAESLPMPGKVSVGNATANNLLNDENAGITWGKTPTENVANLANRAESTDMSAVFPRQSADVLRESIPQNAKSVIFPANVPLKQNFVAGANNSVNNFDGQNPLDRVQVDTMMRQTVPIPQSISRSDEQPLNAWSVPIVEEDSGEVVLNTVANTENGQQNFADSSGTFSGNSFGGGKSTWNTNRLTDAENFEMLPEEPESLEVAPTQNIDRGDRNASDFARSLSNNIELVDNRPTESNVLPTASNTPTAPTEVEAAEVTPTESPRSSETVRDEFNIRRQIVDQARLIRRGADTEMVIRLKPEHLGDLTLRVSVTSSGAVNASFHSDNAQVRMIIENSLVQLKQELADQGIKVDKVEVYTGLADGHMPQGQGQQAWQQNASGGRARNFGADRLEFEETAEGLTPVSRDSDLTEGVDYRV